MILSSGQEKLKDKNTAVGMALDRLLHNWTTHFYPVEVDGEVDHWVVSWWCQ